MSESTKKIWRYYIPSENHEGWAEFLICESGMVSVVSDYGNYAFAWRPRWIPDGDIRAFIVKDLAPDWEYTARKFMMGSGIREQYDGECTYRDIRKYLIDMRKRSRFTAQQFREELELLNGSDVPSYFDDWCRETSLEDAYEFRRTRIPAGVECLCKKTMGRLSDLIIADMDSPHA